MEKIRQLTLSALLLVIGGLALAAWISGREQPFQAREETFDVFDQPPLQGQVIEVGLNSFRVDVAVNQLSHPRPPVTIGVTAQTIINLIGQQRPGTLADMVAGDEVVVTLAGRAGRAKEALYIDVFK